MKKVKKYFLLLLFLLIFATLCTVATKAEETDSDGYYHGELTYSTVWPLNTESDSTYKTHRIPGIVVTKKGTVIVYCEARTGTYTPYCIEQGDDTCLMDVLMMRSTDHGDTFEEPILLAKGTTKYPTVNNPVMIVDNDNTIHFLFCKNYGVNNAGVWYRKSTDDGLSWTDAVNITKFTQSVSFNKIAFGPTHGICTSDGTLMVPVWMTEVTETGTRASSYVFYSTDGGATWQFGERTSNNHGETNIAVLSDGKIILNTRNGSYRKITTSKNGIDHWTETYADMGLPDAECCAGLTAVDIEGLPYAHLFSNCTNQNVRNNLTVKCSFDDCVTWESYSLMISEWDGGYSDIAVDAEGRVYVLFELSFGAKLKLARFSFVDTFMTDETLTSTQTEFDFTDETQLSVVKKTSNLTPTVTENGLQFVCDDASSARLWLTLDSISRNLNLSDFNYIVMNIRVNAENDGDFHFETAIFHGRVYGTNGESTLLHSIPNDGKWHQVVIDLTKYSSIRGMFHGMRLELFTNGLTPEKGDTIEIANIFFSDTIPSAETQEATASTEQEENVSSEKSGCSSALGGAFLPVLFYCGCAFLKKRRKIS